MNKKHARVTGIVRLVAAVLLLVILLVTLSITGPHPVHDTDRPPVPEPGAPRTEIERRP